MTFREMSKPPHVGSVGWRIVIGVIFGLLGLVLAASAVSPSKTPPPMPLGGTVVSMLVADGSKVVDRVQRPAAALTASPTVYDGTNPGGYWQVAEAVAEWGKRSAFDGVMVATPEAASVRVWEVADIYAYCPYNPGLGKILGCAYGDGSVYLDSTERAKPYAEHIALHELGHAFGHGHAPEYRSVMRATVSQSDWYRAPQQYDYNMQMFIYGR